MPKRLKNDQMMAIGMAVEEEGGKQFAERTLARFAFQRAVTDYVNAPSECPRPSTAGAVAILREYVGAYSWKPSTLELVTKLIADEAAWIDEQTRLEHHAWLAANYGDIDEEAGCEVLDLIDEFWRGKSAGTQVADLDAAIRVLQTLRQDIGRLHQVAAAPTPRRL